MWIMGGWCLDQRTRGRFIAKLHERVFTAPIRAAIGSRRSRSGRIASLCGMEMPRPRIPSARIPRSAPPGRSGRRRARTPRAWRALGSRPRASLAPTRRGGATASHTRPRVRSLPQILPRRDNADAHAATATLSPRSHLRRHRAPRSATMSHALDAAERTPEGTCLAGCSARRAAANRAPRRSTRARSAASQPPRRRCHTPRRSSGRSAGTASRESRPTPGQTPRRARARDMGAQAYATGNHVVLGDRADLHTVAHEAAHVVQQRGGVQLKGGVGDAGDAYERQADEAADRVVRGESAEDVLGPRGADSAPRGSRSVQLQPDAGAVSPAAPAPAVTTVTNQITDGP